ncbi:MAG: MmgE/PrpD family protein [Deltaproteobacteria bacterium]|jgi:2-methylcitrate dehydratase PrpD|nr:MmgE/PrpD family protein [Deltaproteobacteria bacterium]
MATGITEKLAAHTAKVRYEDIPPEAIEKAKDCILDQVGVELIGSTLEWNKIAYRYVADMGGRAESTIVNYGTKAPALDAAFVNATFGQGCELDDVGFGAGGHPSAATVPVALALCEKQRITGKDFLAAVVVGCDVMYRLLAAVRPSSGKRGFHSHGIGAPFGAMTTAARLLRLNNGQILHAFGIAGMHSSGTMEYDQTGGEVKRVIAGIAARGGIQAAMLAQLGLTGPPTIIEGKRGFLKVFADEVEPEEITRGLGSDFKIMRVWFKIYPCVATVQGVIFTLAKMIEEHHFGADEIDEIRVGISETSLSHGGAIYEPHDTASAQFSLPFSLAIRLLKNDNDLSFYMDPKLWTDPKVLALAKKVKSYADPNAKKDQNYNTTMEVKLTNGKTFKAFEAYPPGSPLNMVSRDVLRTKFRKMAHAVLAEERIEKLIEAVDRLETYEDAAKLIPLLVK